MAADIPGNIDQLRLPETSSPKTARSPRPAKRPLQREPFLKGPIPWKWLCIAAQCGGKTLPVAVALWHIVGLEKRSRVQLRGKVLKSLGITRQATNRALDKLERAGLVKLGRRNGCRAAVTVINDSLANVGSSSAQSIDSIDTKSTGDPCPEA
jgi:hypothetical protein